MRDLLEGFRVLGPMAGLCVVLAGLAAFWMTPAPSPRVDRAAIPAGGAPPERSRRWPPRDDAPSLGRRWLLSAAAAGTLCFAGAILEGGAGRWSWLLWPGLTLGCTLVLGRLEPLAARRRREQLVMETPQALELMAACLAAGVPIRTAGRAVALAFDGPVGDDLDRARALAELGTSDAEAWLSLRDHPQLGATAQELARSVESGTMMVEGLRHHAEAAREARRAALLVRARGVGVRSVLPLMTCFIPSFLLLGVVPTVVSTLAGVLG
ncbi:MAG: hypothetical protein K0S88_6045 [Actinomycetia bacterium]|nr:hypothetical protein [Actinomycetes bacterium]